MSRVVQKSNQKTNQSSKKQWVTPIVEIIGNDDIKTGTKTSFPEGVLISNGFANSVIQRYHS